MKPEPLTQMTISRNNLYKGEPQHQSYCEHLVDDNNMKLGGPFMPIAVNQYSISPPGPAGGINFWGPSYDPKLHLFGQLKGIAQEWVRDHLKCSGGTWKAQVMHQEITDMACERIHAAISATLAGTNAVRVVLDPFTNESAWILPTAARVLEGFRGSDARVNLVVTCTRSEARDFLGPLTEQFLVFCDPDRAFVKQLGLAQLPAFVFLRTDGTVPLIALLAILAGH